MDIAIPKETKEKEFRVALIPSDVKKLVDAGHSVFVEKDAGLGAGFPDEEYERTGAEITGTPWERKMVVKVKALAADPFQENQIYMAYLHVEKGQTPELLEKLLDKKVTGYAFEEIRDSAGIRLVNLGYEAGLVGMYEGLRTWDALAPGRPFDSLPEIKKIKKAKAFELLSQLDIPDGIDIPIMGDGNVSRGAQDILAKARIKPRILGFEETARLQDFLPGADILVNAVSWSPGQPHLLKKEMLKLMKKTSLVLDISCDRNGAVETCIPTKWENPTYQVEGITHLCIDNLPSAIPHDSSVHLSSMIIPHVLRVAGGEELETGLMTKQGRFVFKA